MKIKYVALLLAISALLSGCTSSYIYIFSKPAHDLATNLDGHIPEHLPLIGNWNYAVNIEGVTLQWRTNNYLRIDSFDEGIKAIEQGKTLVLNRPLVMSVAISNPKTGAVLKEAGGILQFNDGRKLFPIKKELLRNICFPGEKKEVESEITTQEIAVAVDTPERRAQWDATYKELPRNLKPHNYTIMTCLQFEYSESISPTSQFEIDLGTLVTSEGKRIPLKIRFYPAMYKSYSVG